MNFPALQIPGAFIPEPSILYYQIEDGVVHVATSSGTASLSCDRPRLLLRDMIAGRAQSILPSEGYGSWPFTYTVTEAVYRANPPRVSIGLTVPDNAPVDPGLILIESNDFGAYHPTESLQLIGITNDDLFLVFASKGYRATANSGSGQAIFTALHSLIREAKGLHLTSVSPTAFHGWIPLAQMFVKEINEASSLPDQMGGWQRVIDLREQPEHRAFQARVVSKNGEDMRPSFSL